MLTLQLQTVKISNLLFRLLQLQLDFEFLRMGLSLGVCAAP